MFLLHFFIPFLCSNFASDSEQPYFTPLSTPSPSPLFFLQPNTSFESSHPSHNGLVSSLTTSLQEMALDKANNEVDAADSPSDTAADMVPDRTDCDVVALDHRADPPHDDPPHADPPHADPPHADPLHGDPPHDDPLHDDPLHDDPPHADPLHGDPPHDDPLHDDPLHDDPLHDDPLHDDPPHADPPHADPPHADPLHADPLHGDPPHDDPLHDDPLHDDPLHDDPPHADPLHDDPPHADPPHSKDLVSSQPSLPKNSTYFDKQGDKKVSAQQKNISHLFKPLLLHVQPEDSHSSLHDPQQGQLVGEVNSASSASPQSSVYSYSPLSLSSSPTSSFPMELVIDTPADQPQVETTANLHSPSNKPKNDTHEWDDHWPKFGQDGSFKPVKVNICERDQKERKEDQEVASEPACCFTLPTEAVARSFVGPVIHDSPGCVPFSHPLPQNMQQQQRLLQQQQYQFQVLCRNQQLNFYHRELTTLVHRHQEQVEKENDETIIFLIDDPLCEGIPSPHLSPMPIQMLNLSYVIPREPPPHRLNKLYVKASKTPSPPASPPSTPLPAAVPPAPPPPPPLPPLPYGRVPLKATQAGDCKEL